MKNSFLSVIMFFFLTVLASGCTLAVTPVPTSVPPTFTPSSVPPTSTPESTATVTPIASSWEVYTNETWGFSLEHPTAWVVSDNNGESGFIGKQVYWWVSNYDPMNQHGDAPAVDQITEEDINGQRATRVLGHYLGAIGDMGYQQYLKYIIQKGDIFYMFTLYAVDALGIPQEMMMETLPLRQTDTAIFEQMMATVKFKH